MLESIKKQNKAKPSITFEINGKHVCKAGICGDGVLDASLKILNLKTKDMDIRSPGRDVIFHVGGIFDDEYYTWLHDEKLKVGDEITIKIVDSEMIDDPIEVSPVGDFKKEFSPTWWKFWKSKY